MAFLVASLGPLLQFRLWFLLFIPRVAGSLRTMRLFASDLDTAFTHSHTGPSSFYFLSTSSPGVFLDLEIPSKTLSLHWYFRP